MDARGAGFAVPFGMLRRLVASVALLGLFVAGPAYAQDGARLAFAQPPADDVSEPPERDPVPAPAPAPEPAPDTATEPEVAPEPEPTPAPEPEVAPEPTPEPVAAAEEEDEDRLFPGEARVAFRAERPGVSLYVVDDAEHWLALGGLPREAFAELCESPCETVLDEGTQMLALGENGGGPNNLVRLEVPEGGGRLVAEYEDHTAMRIMGVVILVAGVGASIGLGVAAGEMQGSSMELAMGIGSAVVATDAVSLGSFLAGYADRTALRFE